MPDEQINKLPPEEWYRKEKATQKASTPAKIKYKTHRSNYPKYISQSNMLNPLSPFNPW